MAGRNQCIPATNHSRQIVSSKRQFEMALSSNCRAESVLSVVVDDDKERAECCRTSCEVASDAVDNELRVISIQAGGNRVVGEHTRNEVISRACDTIKVDRRRDAVCIAAWQ